MIITIVLLGILAILGANMVGDTMNTAYITTQNHASGSQTRYAAERLTREIREMAYGSSGYEITSNLTNKTTLAFNKEDGTAVTITASGSTLTLGYSPGTTSTLTDQLTAFTMAYYPQVGSTETTDKDDIRFVQVSMSVANAKTGRIDSLRTRVFLRNAQQSP